MRTLGIATLAVVAIGLASSLSAAAELQDAWRAGGLAAPESVVYDADSNTLYVSNMNGGDFAAKDGNGYVSKLDMNGNVIVQKWVEGLNSPKGLDIVNGHLYIADVEQLVEADLASGEVLNRYDAPGAVLLNDVVTSPDGRVFASATMQNAIYQLKDGKFDVFLQDPALEGPNGLIVNADQGKLIVAAVGDLSNGFDKRQPSNVKVVDLTTKEISDFGSHEPIGGLDGLEPVGDGGYLVTDYFAGKLLKVMPDGKVETLKQLTAGSADLEYIPSKGLIIVPLMNDGALAAFKE